MSNAAPTIQAPPDEGATAFERRLRVVGEPAARLEHVELVARRGEGIALVVAAFYERGEVAALSGVMVRLQRTPQSRFGRGLSHAPGLHTAALWARCWLEAREQRRNEQRSQGD